MEIIETSSLIVVGSIIGVGAALAPVMQIAWTMRVLIVSYIAICLVFLVPENLVFNVYANVIYFGGVTFIFALIAPGRFFDATEWLAGRFSFQAFGLSIFTWIFIAAVICFFLPFSYIDFFMTKAVYEILTEYIFYFSVAPLIFAILFSKHLR